MFQAFRSIRSLMLLFVMMLLTQVGWGQSFYNLSSGNYNENFSNIANWANSYASGIGAGYWKVASTATGSTVNTATVFSTSTSGGVQKGSETMILLATGTNSAATDLLLNFSGRSDGVLTLDWAKVTNTVAATPRSSDLKFQYSTDGGISFTDLTGYTIPRILNNSSSESGSINVNLPLGLNNQQVILRFFVWNNGQTGGSGNRPKWQIDNIAVTSTSTTPTSPTITGITPGNQQLSVEFNAPTSDGGFAITTYKYSTDGGTSWQTRTAGSTGSPLIISALSTDGSTALTNGTNYDIQIRAVNSNGDGVASTTTTATPYTFPSAPTINGITAGDQQLIVAFTAGTTGGSALTTYKYSTDGGSNWQTRASGSTGSPLVVTTLSSDGSTALVNGTSYDIRIRAVNAAGDGDPSSITSATPVSSSGPKCPVSTDISPTTDQMVCSGVSATQLLASITTTGTTGTPTYQYQWYYNTSNSNAISVSTTLVSGATSSAFTPPSTSADQGTRYYFCVGYSADNTCSQDNSTPSLASGTVKVTVNVTPDVPTGSVNQSFCSSASPTVVSLAPSGSNVSWFSAASGGTALLSSEVLVNGTVYYAESVSDGCPSASRFAVTATVNTSPIAPTPPSPQAFCYNSLVSDLQATGSNVLWYSVSSGGTALLGTQTLTSRSYYATVTELGCESARSSAVVVSVQSSAYSVGNMVQTAPLDHLVISQVFGGGGNAGSPFNTDFIEIFNPTSASISLANHSVQYASATGITWAAVNLSGSLGAGKYALVSLAAGANGSNLPTANFSNTQINLSASAGKVALVSSTNALTVANPSGGFLIDLVGYGSTANGSEDSPTSAPSNTTSIIRYAGGYADSDVNSTDFYVATPTPRNSSTDANFGEGGLTQEICGSSVPRKMAIEKAAGSEAFSYQWYYKSEIVSDPTGSSVSGWTSLGSIDGANTNAYIPSSIITESRTYACFVTPSGTPICGTAQWAAGARKVTVNQANTWYGETSADWSVSSNWGVCGTPAAGADVTIGVTANNPTLNSATSVGSITIETGAILTLGASANLSIAGSISNNGTIETTSGTITFNGTSGQSTSGLPASLYNLAVSNSVGVTLANDLTLTGNLTNAGTIIGNQKVIMGGSSAQTISGNGTISNLEISNSAGVTISSGSNMQSITGVLTPTDGTLTTNGNLTLKSSADATARVAPKGVTGTITGDVTVERYFKSDKRAWRMVTAPVSVGSANSSIYNNWQTSITASPNTDATTGTTGVMVWGPGGGNGLFAGPSTSTYSMRTWNYATQLLESVTNTQSTDLFTSDGINPKSFFLFVTGPYNTPSITSPYADVRVSAKGSLRQGNQNYFIPSAEVVANNYYLVGNPYASPVNHGTATLGSSDYSLAMTNTTNQIWMWDPNLSGSNGIGGYVSFDRLNNDYSVSGDNTGLSYTDGANYTRLQSGQSFFVRAASSIPSGEGLTVAFTESSKGSDNAEGVFRQLNSDLPIKLRATLQRSFSGNFSTTDGAIAYFYQDGAREVNDVDGVKMMNSANNLMFRRNGASLTFEHRPLIQNNDTLFISLRSTSAGAYRLLLKGSQFDREPGIDAILQDLYLEREETLRLDTTVIYEFAVDANAVSTGDRFRIVFRKKTMPPPQEVELGTHFTTYPNPIRAGESLNLKFRNRETGKYTIAIYNMQGIQVQQQVVMHGGGSSVHNIALNAGLPTGTYLLQIMDGAAKKIDVRKINVQ